MNGIRLVALRELTPNWERSENFLNSNKDFSEMKKFQPKPLKTGVDICLKTPNPEGFRITLKTLRDISISVTRAGGVHPRPSLSEAED